MMKSSKPKTQHKKSKNATKHAQPKPKKQAVADKVVELIKVKGKGDYFGDLLGGLGAKVGQWAGNSLQNGFRKLTGFGDYRTDGPVYNSLVHRKPRISPGGPPSEAPFQMGAMDVKFSGAAPRVQHREFIAAVKSTGSAFASTAYRIQPGVQAGGLFPWGSSVARCFQQYILHGCILEFVSTSSEYASGSALGSVMMSTIYDPLQPLLTNAQQVNNNDYTTTDKPSVSFYHPLECASRDSQVTVRYVSAAPPNVGDTRLTDVGTFQISTLGLTAPVGSEIGQLWCTYDMEFLKAELPDLHADASASFQIVVTNGINGAPAANHNNTFPATYVGNTVQLPAGYAGSWLALMLYSPQSQGTHALVLSNVGSEITPKNLLVNAVGQPAATVYSTMGTATTLNIIGAYAFTTSGLTSTSSNAFNFTISGQAGISGTGQLLLLPVNKALTTALTLLMGEEDRIEKLERLVASLATPRLHVDAEEEEKSDFELLQILRSNLSTARSTAPEQGFNQRNLTKN